MGRCPDLKKLIYRNKGGALLLSHSDILSLRRLKSLDIDCEVEDDAVSSLASYKSLKRLRVVDWDLIEVLPAIGGNLISLEIGVASNAELELIFEYCSNMQCLEIGEIDVDVEEESVDAIKNGLVKLAKLKVNGVSIRLGTDWKGY
jgi:hypothetical protein